MHSQQFLYVNSSPCFSCKSNILFIYCKCLIHVFWHTLQCNYSLIEQFDYCLLSQFKITLCEQFDLSVFNPFMAFLLGLIIY